MYVFPAVIRVNAMILSFSFAPFFASISHKIIVDMYSSFVHFGSVGSLSLISVSVWEQLIRHKHVDISSPDFSSYLH